MEKGKKGAGAPGEERGVNAAGAAGFKKNITISTRRISLTPVVYQIGEKNTVDNEKKLN